MLFTILPETTSDHAAIYEINAQAFGREDEANLVDQLRRSDAFIPALSLIATKEGRALGHILFTKCLIRNNSFLKNCKAYAP